ncbi:DUF2785 domain-containing protein [Sporosarcina sp. Marseille-Q4063]|uniref:DUF2785 domain-containing protein n=1 Tax=Sporosarcina sp. Marseille-Q4063 TaxID=2810514 RepID=UPI001BAE972C|nr:DUF2785 domain-containing protein [Sporosarcina sp. Marseille-Q4063]QUW21998.1 DUF2785 domain-containing protein [Sporosarcina sp. Marseille-Q4063]
MTLTTRLEKYIEGTLIELQREDQDEMLIQIGNPDSYLRDELIYQSYGKMIFSHQLNACELDTLLFRLKQDNNLFHGIGESGTDSVFKRSFSALVIAAIIEYDNVIRQLDNHTILDTVVKVADYMIAEKDTRGFIEGKGWAHSIAHGADVLEALAKHPEINNEGITKILNAIEHSLLRQVNYLDEEEDRLAIIIPSLLMMQDTEKEIQLWIGNIREVVETRLDENIGLIGAYHTQRTVKNFLKSVYLILRSKEQGGKVNNDVFKILEKWMYLR